MGGTVAAAECAVRRAAIPSSGPLPPPLLPAGKEGAAGEARGGGRGVRA